MRLIFLLCIALILCSPVLASAKIIGDFSDIVTPTKTVTLAEAKVKENTATVNETKTNENTVTQVRDNANVAMSTGEEMVNIGIRAFFISIGDSIFSIGGSTNESEAVKNDYGYAVGSVFKIATYENDPYASPTVQAMRGRTAVIGVFIFLLYVFYGAACVNFSCGSMGWVERAQYIVSKTPFSEYKNTLLIAFGAIFFTHYIFRFIILFNQAITTEAMYSVLDAIPLSLDNWFMYLAMSVCYGIECFFFVMRIILMDLIAGSDILLGALFAFSFTRSLSVETIKYFGKITLLQFIIVLLTAFGISIINESPYWQPLGYLCLIVILAVISGGIIFGFSRIFSASKTIVRGAFL